MRVHLKFLALALLAGFSGAALGGCATGPAGIEPAAQAGANEPETDCGRLTGRAQIRILSLRNSGKLTTTTSMSKGINSVTSMVGMSEGTLEGSTARQARDLSELREMNARMKSLGCKYFDLDAALKDVNGGTPKPSL